MIPQNSSISARSRLSVSTRATLERSQLAQAALDIIAVVSVVAFVGVTSLAIVGSIFLLMFCSF
jgi:hypothetical protein